MGKKRKVKEISEEDRIQTILVRDPYGYQEPDTWDAQDRKRCDDGLYVATEWLEFIFGGQGAPGSLQMQRTRGQAVEEIWTWRGRMELLVSVRRDIDLSSELGKHKYSTFLRNPPRGSDESRSALITRAKYESADRIVGMGEGWKSVSSVPFVEVPLIRKHKFVDPYPSPGDSATLQHAKMENEDTKDTKFPVEHGQRDLKPVSIRQEIKAEFARGAEAADIKPALGQPSAIIKGELEAPTHSNISLPIKAEESGVKAEGIDDMIRRAQARREEQRRAGLASSDSSTVASHSHQTHPLNPASGHNLSNQGSHVQQAAQNDHEKHGADIDPRPTKKVKKEEPH